MPDAMIRAARSSSPGYAYRELPKQMHTRLIALPLQQRILDRAAADYPMARVESWLRAGEQLTEERAEEIAFENAALDHCT